MSNEPIQPTNKPEWALPIERRKERADYYFQTILDNQREWYSAKAKSQKRWHLFFAISVILLGAVISCLQVLDVEAWVRYLTAGLGALVSVIRSLDTLLRPSEIWHGYRQASEYMKREQRLYLNNADAYTSAPDEESAYRMLVERVESILAEEQQLFWQTQAKNTTKETDTQAVLPSVEQHTEVKNTAEETGTQPAPPLPDEQSGK